MNRSDNFNRADNTSSLGTPSDGGSAWIAATGTWGVVSGQPQTSSPVAYGMAVLECGSADVDIQVTVTSTSANTTLMLWARASDASNALLAYYYNNNIYIQRYQSGSATTLTSAACTFAVNDAILFHAQGTALSVKKNGTVVASTTSSFNQTVTKHGIGLQNTTLRVMDDLAITDLNTGGSAALRLRFLGSAGG